jgi:anti-sigma factor RsiW
MNCQRVVNLMSAYADGELTGAEMLAIRRHMATCSECAEEHESVLLTKRAVANLAIAKPRQDFAAAILSRLDEVTVPKHQRFADWLIRVLHEKVSPVAAALAVSGAALVLLSAGEVDRLAPVATSNIISAPVQQVGFMKGAERDSSILVSAQPLKLANDIPGMGNNQVHFASLMTQ